MKANYTLEKVETEDGFAATYLLMCDGYQVGSAINIPDIVKGEKYLGSWWPRGARDQCKRTNRKTAAYKIIKATKIMTPKEFKKTYWPDIAASCEGNQAEPALRGRAGRARKLAGEVRHRAQPVRHNRHEEVARGGEIRADVRVFRRRQAEPPIPQKYTPLRGCRTGATNMSWIAPSEIIRLSGVSDRPLPNSADRTLCPAMPYKDDVYQFAYRVAACGYCRQSRRIMRG